MNGSLATPFPSLRRLKFTNYILLNQANGKRLPAYYYCFLHFQQSSRLAYVSRLHFFTLYIKHYDRFRQFIHQKTHHLYIPYNQAIFLQIGFYRILLSLSDPLQADRIWPLQSQTAAQWAVMLAEKPDYL